MKSVSGLAEVLSNLDEMLESSVGERSLADYDLRTLLLFISEVIQIIEQAFQHVMGILVDVSLLQPEDLSDRERLTSLQRRVALLTARSYYRDAAEICSRLKHLGENFNNHIRPKVRHLPDFPGWGGVFGLIDDREGRIIQLVESTAVEIESALAQLDSATLPSTTAMAKQRKEELRAMLGELHKLNGRILGYSGNVGFLELTADRRTLQKRVRIMVDKSVTHGHRVEVGAGAKISGPFVVATTIQDAFKTIEGGVAAPDLKTELNKLCAQVQELLPSVPEQKRADVEQDLSALVSEVSKEKPRRKWYELSAEGLLEAAKACGDIAAPVIATVQKILTLLPV